MQCQRDSPVYVKIEPHKTEMECKREGFVPGKNELHMNLGLQTESSPLLVKTESGLELQNEIDRVLMKTKQERIKQVPIKIRPVLVKPESDLELQDEISTKLVETKPKQEFKNESNIEHQQWVKLKPAERYIQEKHEYDIKNIVECTPSKPLSVQDTHWGTVAQRCQANKTAFDAELLSGDLPSSEGKVVDIDHSPTGQTFCWEVITVRGKNVVVPAGSREPVKVKQNQEDRGREPVKVKQDPEDRGREPVKVKQNQEDRGKEPVKVKQNQEDRGPQQTTVTVEEPQDESTSADDLGYSTHEQEDGPYIINGSSMLAHPESYQAGQISTLCSSEAGASSDKFPASNEQTQIHAKGFSYTSDHKSQMTIHTSEPKRLYKCSVCSKRFMQKFHLKEHNIMRTHTCEKPYKCSICSKRFGRKPHLTGHMRTHTGEKPYKCSICSKMFTTKSSLTVHIMRTHTGEKPFTCSVCSKRFAKKGTLNVHMWRHTGERPYKCSTCSKRFANKSSLNGHIRTHTGEKPYTCSVCSKRFPRKRSLDFHIRIHSRKNYPCTFCNERFTTMDILQSHERIHTSWYNRPKVYKCSKCSKCFAFADLLQKHKEEHNDEVHKEIYKCTRCNSIFTLKEHLETHIRNHTQTCSVLKNSYVYDSSLKHGSKIHTQKVLKCTICNKTFLKTIAFLKHMRTHTHENPGLQG